MGNRMQYLKELSHRALQIADATGEHCDTETVGNYYYAYELWLRYTPTPEQPILMTAWFEASILSETSIFLVVHGFYEQACAALRMQFDGFLTRMYWDTLAKRDEITSYNIDGRLTNKYWEWERGEAKKYPGINNVVWPTLKKEKYVNSFDDHYNLKEDIDAQYQRLNKYIHGRPPSRHYAGATRSSRINIRFEKKHFDEWFELFVATYHLMTIISLLLYPEYLKCESWRKFILLEPDRLDQVNNIVSTE